jgi:phytoene/squalene synthetase
MFTTEQMSDLQTKVRDAFSSAQSRATARAREFEQEARKVLETLGDRAQAEMKTLLQQAQTSSREQLAVLGAELEKLGKKLQEIAARPGKADEKAPEAQPRSETVQ